MQVEKVKYYSLSESQDVEGRYYKEKYRTANKETAEQWKKSSPWKSFDLIENSVIWIDYFDEIKAVEIEAKKKKALAKLIDEEIKLLWTVI